jgi:hypothetical protein
VALIVVLLLLMVTSALMAGFVAVLTGERRLQRIDGDRMEAFYAAHGGLEQLTSDLGTLFLNNYAPTGNQIRALTVTPPSMPGVTFVTTAEGSGYTVDFPTDANGNPVASTRNVTTGPFAGFTGLVTSYRMSVTAQTGRVGEVRLQRELQTVAIPLFQFGQFSETDVAFHPAENFNFGGRIHTNGNLFLAAGSTLTIGDKVTAVGEVIRTHNPNGRPIADGGWTGTVSLLTAPGTYRALKTNEASLVGTLGSAQNANWSNISLSTYHGNVRNGRTGARRLDLPLVASGFQPIELIRRPAPGELVTSPVFPQRYYSLASLRILLSDTAADLTGLTLAAGGAPLSLDTVVGGGYVVQNRRPPLAVAGTPATTTTNAATAAGATTINVTGLAGFNVGAANFFYLTSSANPPVPTLVSCTGTATAPLRFTGCTGTPASSAGAVIDTGYRVPAGTGLNGGFIKIEEQVAPDSWVDVTLEILNLGFAGKQLSPGGCVEPNPDAIIRFQRVKDMTACLPLDDANLLTATNYWPKTLYDAREGLFREDTTTDRSIRPGGVMHYVELDVNNLRRWFLGQIGASGPAALNVTGYTVYFSDRRSNRNAANQETAEYGFEDFVNPGSATGTPNGVLDAGEDVNSSGGAVPDTYGATPRGPAVAWLTPLRDAGDNLSPYVENAAITPLVAQSNPARFFRRALKLVNGRLGNIIAPGLTVASENPVYVQGDYNANGGFGNPHVACSIAGDAITLLSNAWNDRTDWLNPHNDAARTATNTYYRFAALTGKPRMFPWPSAGSPPVNFGSDGGTHNFLRFLESWNGRTAFYWGAMASLYYSRQAVGTFKDIANVYEPPTRSYAFDTDFLNPLLLPPRTPMFRDVNTVGFTQILTPPR